MTTELTDIIREATKQVEDQLNLEDAGWLKLGQTGGADDGVTEAERRATVRQARRYAVRDPLAVQSIRLWTSYTFGTGLILTTPEEDDAAGKILDAFWKAPFNTGVLSPAGQRKSSDRVLTDGELFFAVFIDSDKTARIRRLGTLEITDIITDPDDAEDVRYYRRSWTGTANKPQVAIYRSVTNKANKAVRDSEGKEVSATENTQGAVVFHLAINTIGQRGNSLLTPALEWIKLHRKFLASRAAIMLALARFAWKGKVKGGPGAIATVKAQLDDKLPEAGAVQFENEGVNFTPVSPNSQAGNAYSDARMLRLQVSAAVGWPEQYFGDISSGNLATAKTVELPVVKMCQTYQETWASLYQEIIRYVLSEAEIGEDGLNVDIDFPAITPEDAGELAKSLQLAIQSFPGFVDNRTVVQQALMSIGVTGTDVNRVLDDLFAKGDGPGDPARESSLKRRLVQLLTEVLDGNEEDNDNDQETEADDPEAQAAGGRRNGDARSNGSGVL